MSCNYSDPKIIAGEEGEPRSSTRGEERLKTSSPSGVKKGVFSRGVKVFMLNLLNVIIISKLALFLNLHLYPVM